MRRDDAKCPNAFFPDPQNDNKLTAVPDEIDRIFRDEWSRIFKRPANESPPSWPQFATEYLEYVRPFPACDFSDLSRDELIWAAKRLHHGAPGFDGWRPEELQRLPRAAWVLRRQILEAMSKQGKVPQA